MHKQKNTSLLAFLIALIIAVGGVTALNGYRSMKYRVEPVPEATRFQDIVKEKPEDPLPVETKPEETKPTERKPPVVIRKELNLDAPFYSQAPFGNWDFPWQEACEEASILLAANAYFDHKWTREEFNEQILEMVDWQNERFDTYLDTTAAQTAEILNDYLDLETVTHENPSYEDVVRILNKGHFIIMFFAGKELGNPYFSNGGPNYHVVLVK